jgi:guanylate kinase
MLNKVIVTITGISCSGKSTLGYNLSKNFGWTALRSTTTRSPRAGEVNGVHYDFVSAEDFQKLNLLESVEFAGNFYGLSAKQLEDPNSNVFLAVVEPCGASQVYKFCHDNNYIPVQVFLNCPPDVLASRWLSKFELEPFNVKVKRLSNLISCESKWNLPTSLKELEYSLVIDKPYDSCTQDQIHEAIKQLVELKQTRGF